MIIHGITQKESTIRLSQKPIKIQAILQVRWGVDWQGPMWVPRTTKDRWTRMCATCGKSENTERVTISRNPGYVMPEELTVLSQLREKMECLKRMVEIRIELAGKVQK